MKTCLPKSERGITLIELMIVITVLTILMFMGTSLTRSWIDRSQVNNTINILRNSVQQAKVMALRNPENQALNQAAIHLCLDETNNSLHIVRPKADTSNECSLSSSNNIVLQSTDLASNVFIQHNNSQFKCLAFNAAGVVVSTGGQCATQNQLRFKVGKNNESADITLM